MEKILIAAGTRPEVIKLGPVANALRARDYDVRLVATGRHDELLDQALEAPGLTVDCAIAPSATGRGLSELFSVILTSCDNLLCQVDPRTW